MTLPYRYPQLKADFFMNEKNDYYDNLHAELGAKFGIKSHHIKGIRFMNSEGKDRDAIATKFREKLKRVRASNNKGDIEYSIKLLKFITRMSDAEYTEVLSRSWEDNKEKS